MKSLSLSLLLLACAAPAQVEWTAVERQGMGRALHAIDMSVGDLVFNRNPFPGADLSFIGETALRDPMAIPGVIAPYLAQFKGKQQAPSAAKPALPAVSLAGVPLELREGVRIVIEGIGWAEHLRKQAMAGLDRAEIAELVSALPFLALEDETGATFSFQATPSHAGPSAVWSRQSLLRAKAFETAGDALNDALLRAAERLREIPTAWQKQLSLATPYGRVIVSGVGNDTHDYGEERPAAVIDLGGNDIYRGYVGGALQGVAVVMDMNGNDLYDLKDLAGGAAMFGIGALCDCAGDDVYRGGHLTLGAGLAGAGSLIDQRGNDVYQGGALTEGFGMFGIGRLDDWAGDDAYRARLFAQGAGRTQGVGLLSDHKGDDTYRAGGWLLNSPLFADVHYSFAQGFGSGYREDTGGHSGGLGLLWDGGGDDAYIGETYCQGASYWFATGALVDESGHDCYNAYHYAQASSMHLSVSALFDLAGDDTYAVKFGAAHGIGHDYGVALLADRAGNDVYAAGDSNPGVGNANGVGIFLDSAGSDRYQGPPGRGNPSRGWGSVGLFFDGGGEDKYQTGLSNGAWASNGMWATALDEPDAPKETAATQADAPKPPPAGSLPDPGPAEIEKLYTAAVQWEVGTARDSVRAARNKLIGIGLPAARQMIEQHLATMSRLEARGFEEVFGAVTEAQPLLIARVEGSDQASRNALRLATDLRLRAVIPKLGKLLELPESRRQAILACGELKATEHTARIVSALEGGDQITAVSAAIALGQIADPSSVPGLIRALRRENSMPVREMAAEALAKIGSADPLLEVARARPADARLAMKALRLMKAQEAAAIAGPWLAAPDWGQRLDAVEMLFALGLGETVDEKKESDPIVLARIRELRGHRE